MWYMYNTATLFNIDYFIFGFMGMGLKNPVIGIVNKDTKEFIIDYTGKSTAVAKEKFLSNDLRLPIVKIDGVDYYRASNLHKLSYLQDYCFTVDMFSLSSLDVQEKGYLLLKDKDTLKVNIGLLGNRVWNTGKVFEVCSFTFEYDEFFDDFNVELGLLGNTRIISKPYKYDYD